MRVRIIFCMICLFIAYEGNAQRSKPVSKIGYELVGDIASSKGNRAALSYYFGGHWNTDTTVVSNGKFRFKGRLEEPVQVELSIPGSHFYRMFYLENKKVSIVQKGKNGEVLLTGSDMDKEYEAYKKNVEPLINEYALLLDSIQQLKKVDSIAAVNKEQLVLLPATLKYLPVMKKYIHDHTHSLVSVIALEAMIGQMDIKEWEGLFASIDKKLQQTEKGAFVLREMKAKTTRFIGNPAIDFLQPTESGESISLATFKGKYLLIDFWASWCAPCRGENPHMLKAYKRFKSKGFDIIGISLDDDAAKWKQAVQEDQLPWRQAADMKGRKNTAAVLYYITAIPANFLVDPSGRIIATNLRGDALEETLERIFSTIN